MAVDDDGDGDDGGIHQYVNIEAFVPSSFITLSLSRFLSGCFLFLPIYCQSVRTIVIRGMLLLLLLLVELSRLGR